MKRSLKYNLTLLGCASSCLMSAAFANTIQSGDEEVVFSIEPEVTNVACEALPRFYTYEVKNISAREDIEIEDFFIDIDEDEDSFPDDDYIVQVIFTDTDGFCQNELELEPGDSCLIEVGVFPSAIDCPEEHPVIEDGEIERKLVVHLDAGSQYELTSPIDIDVTILGTAEDYALLADDIFIGGDDFRIATDGMVQVAQNVGFIDDLDDEDDIILLDHAQIIEGLDAEDGYNATENLAAILDATQAYLTLTNLAYDIEDYNTSVVRMVDPDVPCAAPELLLNADQGDMTINSSIYCVVDGHDNDYFVVDGEITLRGDEDSLFVFVMPSNIPDPFSEPFTVADGDQIELEFAEGASFRLHTSLGRVNPNNVFWVGADLIEADIDTSLVGTFLTMGVFEGDSADPDVEGSPASVKGRIIAIPNLNDDGCCGPSEFPESIIELNGNAIIEP